jgi:hypothetical protein
MQDRESEASFGTRSCWGGRASEQIQRGARGDVRRTLPYQGEMHNLQNLPANRCVRLLEHHFRRVVQFGHNQESAGRRARACF